MNFLFFTDWLISWQRLSKSKDECMNRCPDDVNIF